MTDRAGRRGWDPPAAPVPSLVRKLEMTGARDVRHTVLAGGRLAQSLATDPP